MSARAVRLSLVLAFAAALGSPGVAGETGEGSQPTSRALLVEGKLEVRASGADEHEYFVRVGKTTYTLAGADADAAGELRRLVRKMVTARGVAAERGEDAAAVTVTVSGEDVALQKEREILGTVERNLGARFVVVGAKRRYAVRRSAERKFKPFVGKHVVVKGFVVGADDVAQIVDVHSVERRLLPGEREPDSGATAMRGRWKGTITATKVPDNVPLREGVELPLLFETQDPAGELAEGRLMGLYDVKGVEIRKHRHRHRTVLFDLIYAFQTGGKFVVRMEGKYSPDWKTLAGEWSASYLGRGTFEVTFQQE